MAGAAAAFNCLVEQKFDAVMARTRGRPTVMGSITTAQILLMSGAVGGLGLAILWHAVNPLTMWLTLATFVGYAIVYTIILKPATPQNIVIGGASGAMPPVLGWAAITGDVTYQPLLLFLIIFAWTPPHFWALALYRRREYERAGIPMLPVTHGEAFTRLHLLLYTLILVATTLLPFATGMAGNFYLGAALVLDAVFLVYAVAIYVSYTRLAREAHVPVLHLLPRGPLRRADGRPLPAAAVPAMRRRDLVGLALAAFATAGCDKLMPSSRTFNGVDITGSDLGPDFRLTDHNGKERTLADFRGKAVALFFGYTHCPDVCPTTLSDMANAVKLLGPDGQRVQVIFVTVDPKRDTPELLKNYVPAFNPTFLGLYGDAPATAKVTKDFKIYAAERPGKTPESYTVDHSAGLYLLDPQGRLRVFESHGQGAEAIAHDLAQLLRSS